MRAHAGGSAVSPNQPEVAVCAGTCVCARARAGGSAV